MKIKLNKYLKITLIMIILVLAGVVCFFLYNTITTQASTEKKVTLYSYNQQADVKYKVLLKPNILYSSQSLGEGGTYLTEFVDSIRAFFSYQFTGEQAANLQGDYQVVAVMEGYTSGEDKSKTIWQKEFSLVPKTKFEVKDKSTTLSKVVNIKLLDYNSFANQVLQSSKVSTQVKLSAFMKLNLTGKTDQGQIVEKVSPSITLPLNTSYFQIVKGGVGGKPGALQKTQEVKVTSEKKKVIIYSVILGILMILLICLVVFTTGIKETDPMIKTLNKIFKTHGDRLVALTKEIVAADGDCYHVKSIDDLVRVADEIQKPILYKYSPEVKDMTKFYVFADNAVYLFDLTELASLAEKETTSILDWTKSEVLESKSGATIDFKGKD